MSGKKSSPIWDSIQQVAAARDRRLAEAQSFEVSPEEKESRLYHYHPDHVEENFAVLQSGPNEGMRVAREVAAVLEAPTILPEDEKHFEPRYRADVLVIGGGGAGITTAIFASDNGADVLLVTKLRLGDSNTIMAQGGVQVAVGEDDSPITHFLDSYRGGGRTNDPRLLRFLVEKGPEAIAWLEEIGVIFSKDDDGEFLLRKAGGTSRPRVIFAKDYTGLEITRNLIDELRRRNVRVVEMTPAVELLTDGDGSCTGAVLMDYDNGRFFAVQAKVTVLATGGSGRLHIGGFPTSNHYGATGDGLVMGYRAGARIRDLDSFQYHPTGVIYPPQMYGLLVTEAIRSEGGQLVNALGERFVNETETRDFVAASIIRECRDGRGVTTESGDCGVWLDIPVIEKIKGNNYLKKRFPAMFRQFQRFGWDIRRHPVLVYPTLHYQNGGLVVDVDGETAVRNLFAVGEVVGGIHGRNRLMGNSLLEIFTFGRHIGKVVAQRARETDFGPLTTQHLEKFAARPRPKWVGVRSPILLPNYERKT